MASNYLTGNMSVPSSAYGAMDNAHGFPSTGNQSGPLGRPGPSFMDHFTNFQNVLNDSVSSAFQQFKDGDGKDKPKPTPRPDVFPWESGSDGDSQPQKQDYLDAPWASAYGMSKETAYNEAMTNTEYRRAVKDMQAAGLNPAVIFGAGKGSTSGVPGYISSSSRGGGGGGGGRSYGSRSGGNNANRYLFSGSSYSVMSALGGIIGAAATKSAGGYWIGTSLAQGAMHAASGLSKWFKR